ncbi:peptidyl-tRNA hydrolase [Pelotomaculum thermopropionicum SI]|uniref:Peptidyl-tRNA hydrolase n=1 Tax=Pelotomaculum thermopropionicum (strain DSM 13744 / JCM 10971 / SI) TaxID=370438 RepID=A5D633_PELTS|nr:peptidyl-tRNA hydrolase [Pelotomaculum thermopropionicum SI]
MVIDRLAPALGITVGKRMFKALVGQGRIDGEKVVLAKPQTYMNLSGEAVGALLNWYGLTPADLIVVYDDLDLPPGKLRLRAGGGAGGHKGVQSVIRVLGTENFARVRVGIGRPAEPGLDPAGYVLSRFDRDEVEIMREALDLAAAAVLCMVRDGVDRAMNLYNGR